MYNMRRKDMKKRTFTKFVAGCGAAVLLMGTVAGCGKTAEVPEAAEAAQSTQETAETAETAVEEEKVEATDSVAQAPYFKKGVYVNYPEGATVRDYFYVFYDEGAGYTEDANTGTGLPFACEQEDGKVSFSFGGEDGINDVFTVTSTENGIITGSFEDGQELHFELKEDADPDNFDAMKYAYPSTEEVYEDANGWKVKYNSELFEVNHSDNIVTFVYTGESAGTNMITATYDVDMKAKEAVDKVADSWESDNVTKTEGVFPGTEDVDAYYAVLPPSEEGSGLYETVIARDYMDGYLMFELTGHNSGDEALDMEVSDALAMIIDSIQFPYEQ